MTPSRRRVLILMVVLRAGQAIFIDPLVAVGYKYAIGAGDPEFASVLLPAVQNNFILAFLTAQTLTQLQIAANAQSSFPKAVSMRLR
jgi:hypothetical protein